MTTDPSKGYVIYTMDNCSYCSEAKMLLKNKGMTFSEIKLGKDISRADFLNRYPSQRTLPMILIDGARLGGLNELKAHFDMSQNKTQDTQ